MRFQADEFTVFEWDVEGRRLVGSVNLALVDFGAKSKTPWFLSLSTPLSSPTPEGLPTKIEAEKLNEWETEIERRLGKYTKFVFVGRVTWNGHRELLYYVDDPKRLAPELQNLITQRFLRPFAFRCEHDPNWAKVQRYLGDSKH